MTRIAKIRLLLLALILLTFGRTATHEFVDWDDGKLIFLNDNIAHPTMAGLARHWNPYDKSNGEMYNPLVYSTWWILAQGAQVQDEDLLGATLNPYVFHAANLLVYCLTALVVLEILRRLGMPDWPAAAGAIIFAVHPIQTEVAAWATAMKDLLSGLLAMLAIWRYLLATQSQASQRRRNYCLATALFVAAMLAKPSTVILPLILAAIELILYRRPWRQVAARLAPWVILAAATGCLALSVQPLRVRIVTPLWARPLIALDALAFYMYKIVLPIHLNFDYGRNPAAVLTNPALHYPLYWTWLFPLAAGLLLWRLRRRELTTAALIFVAGVLPVLGFSPFVFQFRSTVADRFVYVSMLGLALAVAWGVSRIRPATALSIVCPLVLVLASLSFVQAGRWKDSETLAEYGLSLSRDRAIDYSILAQYRDRQAQAAYRHALLARSQGDHAAEIDFLKQRNVWLDQAISAYRTAVSLEAGNINFYNSLSADLLWANRTDEAIKVIDQWIHADPLADPSMRQRPGSLEKTLGLLYMKTGRYPQAIGEFRKSLRLYSDPEVQQQLRQAETLAASSAAATTRPSTRVPDR